MRIWATYTRKAVFALCILWSVSMFADEPITYTRFLVPLYDSRVPGAFGSLWETSTWVLFSGQQAIPIIPRTGICVVLCPGVGGVLYADEAPRPLLEQFMSAAGVLVHVPADHAADVSFGSRVRDISRDAESAGTEVPVIPENEMVNAPIRLFDVRVGARMRDTLRIYALPETPAPEADVRFYRWPVEVKPGQWESAIELLAERRVALRESPAIDGVRLIPSFALLGNIDQIPELAGEDSVWIEIAPVTPGLRIWAMASITNNDTQQLTLVTPQRAP